MHKALLDIKVVIEKHFPVSLLLLLLNGQKRFNNNYIKRKLHNLYLNTVKGKNNGCTHTKPHQKIRDKLDYIAMRANNDLIQSADVITTQEQNSLSLAKTSSSPLDKRLIS